MGTQLVETKIERRGAALLVVPDDASAAQPVPLTVALHGMGQTAHEFARILQSAIGPGRAWLIPDGWLPFEHRRNPGIGFAWYLFAGDQERLWATMGEAAQALDAAVDDALRLTNGAIDADRVSLLGFSQGGYLASVCAGWSPSRYRACCVIGGRIKHEFFARGHAGDTRQEAAAASKSQFLQLHGDGDQSVPAAIARQAVEAAVSLGYRAEMRTFSGAGHEVTPEMLSVFTAWVGQIDQVRQ